MTPTRFLRPRILDASFHYKPSFDTDIRKTFERARAQHEQEKAHSRVNVVPLDPSRKIAAA
jgi:hypothetical protein